MEQVGGNTTHAPADTGPHTDAATANSNGGRADAPCTVAAIAHIHSAEDLGQWRTLFKPLLENVRKAGVRCDLWVVTGDGEVFERLLPSDLCFGAGAIGSAARAADTCDRERQHHEQEDGVYKVAGNGDGGEEGCIHVHTLVMDTAPDSSSSNGHRNQHGTPPDGHAAVDDATAWLGCMWILAHRARAGQPPPPPPPPYRHVLKLHTRPPFRFDARTLKRALSAIMGTPRRVRECMWLLEQPALSAGMVAPCEWVATSHVPNAFLAASECTRAFARTLGLDGPLCGVGAPPVRCARPVGGVFWARWDAIVRPFVDAPAPPHEPYAGTAGLIRSLHALPKGSRAAIASLLLDHTFGALLAAATHGPWCVVGAAANTARFEWCVAGADGDGGTADATCAAAHDDFYDRAAVHAPHAHRSGPPIADALMDQLEMRYLRAASERSDIFEHVERLRRLADECTHVTQLGGHGAGGAAWAFLRGLARADNWPPDGAKKKWVCVAHEWDGRVAEVFRTAQACGIAHELRLGHDLDMELESTDLLFVDDWHAEGHVRRQLMRHHARVRRWIVLHDTTIDGMRSESVRLGEDIAERVRTSGYSLHEVVTGIWPAIEKFLAAHPHHWALAERLLHCNGLAILQRIAPAAASRA